MTGFGKAEGQTGGKDILVEIKSLNGKQFDFTNKLTPLLKAYEAEIRKILLKKLKRGSIDLMVTIKQDGAAKPMKINTQLAKTYFQAINDIAAELHLPQEQMLATLMRLPEVVAPEADSVSESDWQAIRALIEQAADRLLEHRRDEGQPIGADLLERISAIENHLAEAELHEPKRLERIRSRIGGSLEDWIGAEKLDMNRLEQELIYYIEKIDFSEEKQRLRVHCQYFKQLVQGATEEGVGKKLGFVLQEVGREINTLGSKANDAAIQQIVVNMKDELEKAKEQVLNIV